MKACGIIAEYNPFHAGHAYQVAQAKKITGADCVIAVMSGNWLQRGEPALVDKWARAKMALDSGCDLVIELPVHYAVQSADFFARGAVKLLNALNIESLCFGTDVKNEFDYEQFGQLLVANEEIIQQELDSLQHSGLSYVNRMREVYSALGLAGHFSRETPNHLLALSYAKEVAKQNPAIHLVPIKRVGAGFHDELTDQPEQNFASASGLRQFILAGKLTATEKYLPAPSYAALLGKTFYSWDNFYPLLQYQLTLQTPAQLQMIYQMTEGLENLLKAQLGAPDFSSYLQRLKTKRYSFGRLARVLSYTLLGITQAEISAQTDFLRVLGFSEAGQRYLNTVKKTSSLPLIAKQTKRNQGLLALNNRVDALYQLGDITKEQVLDHPPWRV